MKESYCGLCDTCPLDQPDFLNALSQVRNFIEQMPIYWWRHCFPGNEGFSIPEFIKGIDWFLNQPECLGCKQGGGLKECPIRQCAAQRQVIRCSECQEQEGCERYNIIMEGFPGRRIYLHRFSIRIGS
jgi:hypothetical protein